MKKTKIARVLFTIIFSAIGTALSSLQLSAATEAVIAAENNSEAIKAALKELDLQIDRLDELEYNAPNKEEKDAAKARIKVLKERRSELRKSYVQARYDALKADVKIEYDRLSNWTKKTFGNSPETKDERSIHKTNAESVTGATANAVTAGADIDAYEQTPSDQNKAEVRVALDALDSEIKRLESSVNNMPDGGERDLAKRNVSDLKDRRKELASDFRKARYEALKADIKSQWENITR